jgi:hypothetical protein
MGRKTNPESKTEIKPRMQKIEENGEDNEQKQITNLPPVRPLTEIIAGAHMQVYYAYSRLLIYICEKMTTATAE